MAYYRRPIRFISNRTRINTPALFGAPADTPACAMGTMCGAPEAEVEPEPVPEVPVVQAGIMPAPGAWVWAGLGLVGGYVLHSMMKKGK